ncbi:MAG: hypothetical protein ACOCQR_01870 [bacterium]
MKKKFLLLLTIILIITMSSTSVLANRFNIFNRRVRRTCESRSLNIFETKSAVYAGDAKNKDNYDNETFQVKEPAEVKVNTRIVSRNLSPKNIAAIDQTEPINQNIMTQELECKLGDPSYVAIVGRCQQITTKNLSLERGRYNMNVNITDTATSNIVRPKSDMKRADIGIRAEKTLTIISMAIEVCEEDKLSPRERDPYDSDGDDYADNSGDPFKFPEGTDPNLPSDRPAVEKIGEKHVRQPEPRYNNQLVEGEGVPNKSSLLPIDEEIEKLLSEQDNSDPEEILEKLANIAIEYYEYPKLRHPGSRPELKRHLKENTISDIERKAKEVCSDDTCSVADNPIEQPLFNSQTLLTTLDPEQHDPNRVSSDRYQQQLEDILNKIKEEKKQARENAAYKAQLEESIKEYNKKSKEIYGEDLENYNRWLREYNSWLKRREIYLKGMEIADKIKDYNAQAKNLYYNKMEIFEGMIEKLKRSDKYTKIIVHKPERTRAPQYPSDKIKAVDAPLERMPRTPEEPSSITINDF